MKSHEVPPRPTLRQYLFRCEGWEWHAENTNYVLNHLAEVERAYQQVIRKREREAQEIRERTGGSD